MLMYVSMFDDDVTPICHYYYRSIGSVLRKSPEAFQGKSPHSDKKYFLNCWHVNVFIAVNMETQIESKLKYFSE